LPAATANVSYRKKISAEEVEQVLISGQLNEKWLTRIAIIIDETSNALRLQALREVAGHTNISPLTIWRILKHLASELSSPHERWQHATTTRLKSTRKG